MTGRLEERLTTEFREYAAGVRLETDVLGAAAARHGRRATRRRLLATGGAVGVAAALSGVLVLGGTGQPPAKVERPRAAGPQAQTPAMRLAAAVQTTTQNSFRLRMVFSQSNETGRLKGYSVTTEYDGAFDAAADRGFLRVGPTRVRGRADGKPVPIEMRIIGEDVFVGRPDTGLWKRRVPRSDLADLFGAGTPAAASLLRDLPVGAGGLLTWLRKIGTVTPAGRSGSGDSAVDTYAFTYRVGADASTAAHDVTGTAEIGAGSTLTRITQQTVTVGANPEIADSTPLTWKTVVELSDYGTPVRVEKPARPGA